VLPLFVHRSLVDRLKIMAEIPLDTAPPQQGRIIFRHEQQDYNAQVEITPGEFGEVITIRISKPDCA
jgi:type II secretory ATPase GspE/PulE/Tfp pilus assembly ATPase PilB-like protein